MPNSPARLGVYARAKTHVLEYQPTPYRYLGNSLRAALPGEIV